MRSLALLALLLLLTGCGGPSAQELEAALENRRPPPWTRYYEALRPGAVYLFASLAAKGQFDRDPDGMEFEEYIRRTGGRVFVHVPDDADVPALPLPATRPMDVVGQIASGFEDNEATVLTLAGDPDAPPVSPFRPEIDANGTVGVAPATTAPARLDAQADTRRRGRTSGPPVIPVDEDVASAAGAGDPTPADAGAEVGGTVGAVEGSTLGQQPGGLAPETPAAGPDPAASDVPAGGATPGGR